MSDRLLREIRDRLTALVAMTALLVVLAIVATGILFYWSVKAESLRQRLLKPPLDVVDPLPPARTSTRGR